MILFPRIFLPLPILSQCSTVPHVSVFHACPSIPRQRCLPKQKWWKSERSCLREISPIWGVRAGKLLCMLSSPAPPAHWPGCPVGPFGPLGQARAAPELARLWSRGWWWWWWYFTCVFLPSSSSFCTRQLAVMCLVLRSHHLPHKIGNVTANALQIWLGRCGPNYALMAWWSHSFFGRQKKKYDECKGRENWEEPSR